MCALTHQFVELFARAAAFGSDAHHCRAAIRLRASNSLNEPTGLQLFEHARHRAGSNSRTRCQIGNARAFLLHQRAQDRALALAQSFAADFVRADWPEYAGQAPIPPTISSPH